MPELLHHLCGITLAGGCANWSGGVQRLQIVICEGNVNCGHNSIAFILQYNKFRMLFTGDADVEAEQHFLGEGIDLHADALKVGHHGFAYSNNATFIAAVHAKYAIISVGRRNKFGHPAPSTVERLARYGARVYRTDDNSAVSITTDGSSIAIHSMLEPLLAPVLR